MNFEKYSKEKFSSLGLNTPDGRKLADQLQDDINKILQPGVAPIFLDIIDQLNACGHNLQPSLGASGGKLSFRDEPIKNQSCLRLGCDVVVTAGYGHDRKLNPDIKKSVAEKLQETWKVYIDGIHRFIALNLSAIAGVAAVVSFVASLHKTAEGFSLVGKRALFAGVVLLVVCFLLLVIIRIWVQQFMDYEVMQPREDVEKYFQGRIHYSQSYRLSEWSYRWQYFTVRVITIIAPLTFLAGLSLSLLFLYKNLQ